jgi:hypothetical protein
MSGADLALLVASIAAAVLAALGLGYQLFRARPRVVLRCRCRSRPARPFLSPTRSATRRPATNGQCHGAEGGRANPEPRCNLCCSDRRCSRAVIRVQRSVVIRAVAAAAVLAVAGVLFSALSLRLWTSRAAASAGSCSHPLLLENVADASPAALAMAGARLTAGASRAVSVGIPYKVGITRTIRGEGSAGDLTLWGKHCATRRPLRFFYKNVDTEGWKPREVWESSTPIARLRPYTVPAGQHDYVYTGYFLFASEGSWRIDVGVGRHHVGSFVIAVGA